MASRHYKIEFIVTGNLTKSNEIEIRLALEDSLNMTVDDSYFITEFDTLVVQGEVFLFNLSSPENAHGIIKDNVKRINSTAKIISRWKYLDGWDETFSD